MSHPAQVISRKTESAIAEHLIAAVGTEPRGATLATGTNTPIGVCIQPGTCEVGDVIDIVEVGTADVLCGGSVAAGDIIGADSSGRAVKVTSGVALGVALEAGAEGDVIEVRVCPHAVTAPTA
ncbi:MAG: DUF2190 family protein [Myxococcaceae bacterium]|nr:DUF2190 family protein [Myxococcaceae bacterium]